VTVGLVHTTRRKAMRRRRARRAEPDVGTAAHTLASSHHTITTMREDHEALSVLVAISSHNHHMTHACHEIAMNPDQYRYWSERPGGAP
jgi:hypothetical protein